MNTRPDYNFEQLKINLISIINTYINYREDSLIVKIFHNEELTQERITLARETITAIETAKNHDDLIDLMENKKLENARLSNKYFKQHSNHFTYFVHDSSSVLANIFHTVINTINADKQRTQPENITPKTAVG